MKKSRVLQLGCNWVFQLQWTLAIHGIYIALNVIRQVVVVAVEILCHIQYCMYGATHMQLYATSLQLISTSDSTNIPTWHFIHLSMNDVS